jgi:hypothetical protein
VEEGNPGSQGFGAFSRYVTHADVLLGWRYTSGGETDKHCPFLGAVSAARICPPRQPGNEARAGPADSRQISHFFIGDGALDLGGRHPGDGVPGYKPASLLRLHDDAVKDAPRGIVNNLLHCSETAPGARNNGCSFPQCRIGNRRSFPTRVLRVVRAPVLCCSLASGGQHGTL